MAAFALAWAFSCLSPADAGSIYRSEPELFGCDVTGEEPAARERFEWFRRAQHSCENTLPARCLMEFILHKAAGSWGPLAQEHAIRWEDWADVPSIDDVRPGSRNSEQRDFINCYARPLLSCFSGHGPNGPLKQLDGLLVAATLRLEQSVLGATRLPSTGEVLELWRMWLQSVWSQIPGLLESHPPTRESVRGSEGFSRELVYREMMRVPESDSVCERAFSQYEILFSRALEISYIPACLVAEFDQPN